MLYVLDEPSIGLHQRDNARLLETLKRLRDLGNTVIVVEHDEDAIRTADYVLDIGPGAGIHGGHIVAEGTVDDLIAAPRSWTGKYLSGELAVPIPERRPRNPRRTLAASSTPAATTSKASTRKSRSACSPASPASPAAASRRCWSTRSTTRWRASSTAPRSAPAPHDRIEGLEHIDKIIDIDQSPIGRTPRSNPATYTGAFTPIREWFAALPESKARGYEPGRFSFNVKGGRCEACQGDGVIKIEMHFLPDVYVTCDVCKGKRYNRETLEVLFKGKSIADVLDMTVEEALEFFKAVPRVRDVLALLAPRRPRLHPCRPAGHHAVGRRGAARQARQGAVASAPPAARSIFSTSRPPACISTTSPSCLDVLHELVETGNTVVVIEHNLEVIKTADWIIDLGPEGGDGGGEIVAPGHAGGYCEGEAKLYGGVFEAGVGAGGPGTEEEGRAGGGVNWGNKVGRRISLPSTWKNHRDRSGF